MALNKLRRDVWTGGGAGLGIGFLVGLTGYQAIAYIPSLKQYRTGKYLTSGVLIASALGSFLGATVMGKNKVQEHTDIFRKNANPTGSYSKIVQHNRNLEMQDMEQSFENRRRLLEKRKEGRN
jgi:hypothetical protein